ncbi:MAG: adenosylcobalamin-dependent ribonucleoside-diphosphate reductase [Gammaproteobacteria bacterium]|nr:MAG: adenosylcobalamin-dependent ribonucleoside-diphosphate reductase [Gammaproteobacteria bacterium]
MSPSERPAQDPFAAPIARHIWELKYRYRDGAARPVAGPDASIQDTWRRVARALAAVERDPETWEGRFYALLEGFRFIPGGRILAGAGTGHQVTLFNCFVMGHIPDAMEGIFDALKEGALTMQQGGGVGYDFSTLRPRGARAYSVGSIASGPVSFMRIWDAMCATILSTGARRGAMMGTLRCDHPDVEEFVEAKRRPGELRHFNISVLVSDAFLEAVDRDEDWPLVFPEPALGPAEPGAEVVERAWSGEQGPVRCRVLRRVRARALWDRIVRATYEVAEPGVLFIDRINRMDNLGYRERISATNPCGEVPLPPYGACDLGSFNLTRFVREPFTERARLDLEALEAAVPVAVRLLDNVIDASRFPLPAQAEQARGARRIGLGITGLADALLMLGLRYGEPASLALAREVMGRLCRAAYRASVELAREKGAFPYFVREAFLERPFVRALPEGLREAIARHGIRNSHLLAIAPTGTISLLAGNVSSGLEPIFEADYLRRVLDPEGEGYTEYRVTDYAVALWRRLQGRRDGVPPAFVEARELDPREHLAMQAALQPCVDQAISKTINVPEDYPFEAFRELYRLAHREGLKGCTTFRPNPVTGAVLREEGEGAPPEGPHCCSLEREGD